MKSHLQAVIISHVIHTNLWTESLHYKWVPLMFWECYLINTYTSFMFSVPIMDNKTIMPSTWISAITARAEIKCPWDVKEKENYFPYPSHPTFELNIPIYCHYYLVSCYLWSTCSLHEAASVKRWVFTGEWEVEALLFEKKIRAYVRK